MPPDAPLHTMAATAHRYQPRADQQPGTAPVQQGPAALHLLAGSKDRSAKLRAKAAKQTATFQAVIEVKYQGSPEQARAALDAEEQALFTALQQSDKSSKAQNQLVYIEAGWLACLEFYTTQDKVPIATEETMWHEDMVSKYAHNFLPYKLTSFDKPKLGKTSIKALTLDSWACTFTELIAANTRNTQGERRGIALLSVGKLYTVLSRQVIDLIGTHNLERWHEPRVYYGLFELALILQQVLASKNTTRIVQVQIGTRMLFSVLTTARSSTFGPTEAKWKVRCRYMVIGDVRILLKGPREPQIIITLRNFKMQIASTSTNTQTFHLNGVLRAHNVIFDPTVWVITLLYLRGAFPWAKTVRDVLDYEGSEIPIAPELLEQPLFLAVTPGGRSLIEGQAAMADAAGAAVHRYAKKAGLKPAGTGAFRRGSADHYAAQLGNRVSRDFLNHASEEGVYRDHYSRNVSNFDVTALRFGETAGRHEKYAGEVLESTIKKHSFAESAVDAMLRQMQVQAEPAATSESKKAQDKAELNDEVALDPAVIEAQALVDKTWEDFHACFNHARQTWRNKQKGTPAKMFTALDADDAKLRLTLPKATAQEASPTSVACDTLTERQSSRRRTIRAEQDKAATLAQKTAPLLGTPSERLQALAQLQQPSAVLTEALEMPEQHEAEMDEEEVLQAQKRRDQLIKIIKLHSRKQKLDDPTPPTDAPPEDDPDRDEDEEDEIPQIDQIDYDESKEEELVAAPVQDVRRALMEYLVAPVVEHKRFLAECEVHTRLEDDVVVAPTPAEAQEVSPTDEEVPPTDERNDDPATPAPRVRFFKCPKCRPRRTLFQSYSGWRRHMTQVHSAWADLKYILQPGEDKQIHCPDCSYRSPSEKIMREHMLSDNCPARREYRGMKAAHDLIREKYPAEKTEQRRSYKAARVVDEMYPADNGGAPPSHANNYGRMMVAAAAMKNVHVDDQVLETLNTALKVLGPQEDAYSDLGEPLGDYLSSGDEQ
ncbi:hypothetical protein C8J57DRAFT_1654582, partial [Mycena rebaudengoi]